MTSILEAVFERGTAKPSRKWRHTVAGKRAPHRSRHGRYSSPTTTRRCRVRAVATGQHDRVVIYSPHTKGTTARRVSAPDSSASRGCAAASCRGPDAERAAA